MDYFEYMHRKQRTGTQRETLRMIRGHNWLMRALRAGGL